MLKDGCVQAALTSPACHEYTLQVCFRHTAQFDANRVIKMRWMECLGYAEIESIGTMKCPVQIMLVFRDWATKVSVLGVMDRCCLGRTRGRVGLNSTTKRQGPIVLVQKGW